MIRNLNEFSEYKTVTTIDGHEIRVNPYDHYICRDLAKTGQWEPHIRTVLSNLCKPGMNFIDIGANVGSHTLYMSKLVGSTGKGFAFEPCNSHASILFFNLMNNQCFNTTVYQYGCSNVETTMYIKEQFTNTKKSTNFGAIVLQSEKMENDETVKTLVLDSIDFPPIHVVKIDAEGMEEKIILGMNRIIQKDKPIIVLEIHDEHKTHMLEFLSSINYKAEMIGYSWEYIASPI